MSVPGWNPGRVSLLEPPERVPNLKLASEHDRRSAERYTADLQQETDRSLRSSPNWRAGQPLEDHRGRCGAS